MRILLVEPDYGAQFPSLGLLKIAEYHRLQGDEVKYVKGNILVFGEFNQIYITSLYTWTWRKVANATKYYKALYPGAEVWLGGIYPSAHPEHAKEHTKADCIHQGLFKKCEDLPPYYEVLSDEESGWVRREKNKEGKLTIQHWNASLVYSSRGCTRKCSFCVVPKIEGKLKPKSSIKPYIKESYDWIVLWDNDFLLSPYRDDILDELKEESKKGKKIDFNQGLRASQIDEEVAKQLATLNLRFFDRTKRGTKLLLQEKQVRIAYDFLEQGADAKQAIENLSKVGFRERNILVYNLYNYHENPDEFFERVRNTLKWGATSFPMRYQPITGENSLEKNRFIDEEAGWTQEKLKWIKSDLGKFGSKYGKVSGGIFSPYYALVRRMEEAKNFVDMFKPIEGRWKFIF